MKATANIFFYAQIELSTSGSNTTFDTGNNLIELVDSVTGPGGLVKMAPGTLDIANGGDAAYTGPTIINQGILEGNVSTGALSIGPSGVFDMEARQETVSPLSGTARQIQPRRNGEHHGE